MRGASRWSGFGEGGEGEDEAMAKGGGPGGEGALSCFVFGSALGGFDRDGGVAKRAEVVGAGAHVQDAGVEGEEETVEDEVGADPGREFVGPFVEVHVGVEAASLFEGELVVALEGPGVARLGGGREEAVGVEVGAGEWTAFDEVGQLPGIESEREARVAEVVGAIDHGPLVETETGEVSRALSGRLEEVEGALEPRSAGQREGIGREDDALGGAAVAGVVEEGFGSGSREDPSGAGMPLSEP